MWAPRYFPPRYFAPRYWADGSGVAAPPATVVLDSPAHLSPNGKTRIPILERWNKPEAAGGTRQARIPRWGPRSDREWSLRGDGGLRLDVPADASWLDGAEIGHVIQVHDPVRGTDGGEFWTRPSTEEYRIRRLRKVDGPRDAITRVEAWPIITDLARCGPIYVLGTDGVPDYEIGEVTITWAEAWDTYILPFLTDLGITWWERQGSISGAVTVSISQMTPLALLRAIGEAAAIPFQTHAFHNGSSAIQVTPEVTGFHLGLSSPTRRLNVSVDGESVLSIADDQTSERTASVAVPLRTPPAGSDTTLGLYGLVFRVTAVNGSDISLEDPEITSSLFKFDDSLGGATGVYPNHYLRRANGTLTEIQDHDGQDVTVADPSNISVDDLVEIRRDASDNPPVEAVNPGLLDQGRAVRTVADDNPFARNYTLNPHFSAWPNTDYPEAYAARVDTGGYTGGATTLNLKDLPVSTTIKDRSRIVALKTGDWWTTTVDGDTATDGAGDVTLTLDSALSNATNLAENARIFVFQEPDEDLADDWASMHNNATSPSGAFATIYAKRDLTEAVTDVTGAVATTVSLGPPNGTGATITAIDLDGLPAGQVLQPGDLIVRDLNDAGLVVMARAQANGSGEATAHVFPLTSQTWTAAEAVTITRPDFAGSAPNPTDAIVCWRDRSGVSSSTEDHGFLSGAVRVPFVDGWVLRATMRWGVYNNTESDITVTPAAGVQGLTVAIQDASGAVGSEVASTEDAERTYASRTLEVVTITTDHTPTSEAEYRVRCEPVHIAGSGAIFNVGLTMCLLEVSLSYGPAAHTQTGVEYSHTNRLYRRMVQRLDSLASPRTIEVTVQDVAYSVRDTPADEVAGRKIILGAPWFLRSTVLGLDAKVGSVEEGVVRVTRYRQSLWDPMDASVVLDHDVFRLSHGD